MVETLNNLDNLEINENMSKKYSSIEHQLFLQALCIKVFHLSTSL